MKNQNTIGESKKIGLLFLINSIFLFAVIWLCPPSFELNDDVIMSSFVNGAYSAKDAHLLFENYLLGMLFKFLYTVGGTSIPWYTVFQYFTVLCSFMAVSYVLVRRLTSSQTIVIVGVSLLYFGYECYVRMQFTKTAAVAMSAGLLLLFHTITEVKVSPKMYIVSLMLILLGFCYRVEEAVSCMGLMMGVGIFLLGDLKKMESKERLRKLGLYVGSLGIVVALMLGAYMFDKSMYQTEEWSYYNKWTSVRSELVDYGMPDYDAHIEEYQALGVTRSAYNMFKSLNFGDQDVFSLEVMEKILDMRKIKTVTVESIKQFILYFYAGMITQKAFYPLLLFGVLWIFWSKKDAKSWLVLFYLGVVFICGYFYMYYRGRFLENRVDVGLCFAASLVLVWMYTREKSKISIQGSWIACICLLIVLQKNWYSTEKFTLKYFGDEYDASVLNNQQIVNIINEIEEDTEHIYFAKVGAFPFMSIQYMSDGLLDRVIWLGNYTVNTKLYLDTMASHGITNSYQYMLENDDVYLIDNNIDLTMEYIHDYYDKDATYQLVKQVGAYSIYEIQADGGGKNEE